MPSIPGTAADPESSTVMRVSAIVDPHRQLLIAVCSYLLVVALFGSVSYLSPGYDDEITNVTLVERSSLSQLVHIVNSTDVHPPGSYVMNWLLFHLLHDWHLVRLVSGILSASALWLLFTRTTSDSGPLQRSFGYASICLSPTALLWLTGLRWYAYFVPVLVVLVVSLNSRQSTWRFWLSLWAGLAVLFHIGYAVLVIGPAVVLYAGLLRRQRLRMELPACLAGAAVAGVACVPQLLHFLAFHLPNLSSQVSTLPRSFAGLALHTFNGQAFYPVSLAGVVSIAANLGVFVLLIKHPRICQRPISVLFLTGCLLLAVSKLAGKFRNLVMLTPFQGVVSTDAFASSRSSLVKGALLALMFVAQLLGIYNVAAHVDTTKGSWNTPYAEVLRAVHADGIGCRRTIVFTKDAVLLHELARLGYSVARERTATQPPSSPISTDDCIVELQTFRGSMSPQDFQTLFGDFKRLRASFVISRRFGADRFARFKRRFDSDVPDYYVTETLYRGAVNPESLASWLY
jgi:hypothetical protein